MYSRSGSKVSAGVDAVVSHTHVTAVVAVAAAAAFAAAAAAVALAAKINMATLLRVAANLPDQKRQPQSFPSPLQCCCEHAQWFSGSHATAAVTAAAAEAARATATTTAATVFGFPAHFVLSLVHCAAHASNINLRSQ